MGWEGLEGGAKQRALKYLKKALSMEKEALAAYPMHLRPATTRFTIAKVPLPSLLPLSLPLPLSPSLPLSLPPSFPLFLSSFLVLSLSPSLPVSCLLSFYSALL